MQGLHFLYECGKDLIHPLLFSSSCCQVKQLRDAEALQFPKAFLTHTCGISLREKAIMYSLNLLILNPIEKLLYTPLFFISNLEFQSGFKLLIFEPNSST